MSLAFHDEGLLVPGLSENTIQAVERICQTNSGAAVFEMHHNDFFAKMCHCGVEFQVCGGDRELKQSEKQGCKTAKTLVPIYIHD